MQHNLEVHAGGIKPVRAPLAGGVQCIPDKAEECRPVHAMPERNVARRIDPVGNEVEHREQGVGVRQDNGGTRRFAFMDYAVCFEGLGMSIMA